eukprot:IDg23393t1
MAEAALPVFGAVATSINLVKTGIGMCIALQKSLKNYKNLQDQAGGLCNLYKQVKADLEEIDASHLDPNSNCDEFETLVQATREQLSAANSTVEELNSRLSEASDSKRRCFWKCFKMKTVVLDASGVTDISSGLQNVRACVQHAASNCTQITNFRSLHKKLDKLQPQEISDVFEAHFDKPSISRSVVLDFESCDATGTPITAEGRLRRKVLELIEEEAIGGVSAIGKQRGGVHGMGGVGKTTALRGLCHDELVKQAYKDGICFLEFGQDANEQKVINEVARCMRDLGGIKLAQEMCKAS